MVIDLEDYKYKPTIPEMEARFDMWGSLDLAAEMNEIRAIKEELETALKYINTLYDYVRINKLPKQMEEEGIESLTLFNVGRVNLTGDMYVLCPKENKSRLHQYLMDIGKGDLITEVVNASSLKAAVKEMIKKGEELPEGLLKITPFTRAVITKK
jgi:hypothetical protein